jgi:biotin carboxyl carrier protein
VLTRRNYVVDVDGQRHTAEVARSGDRTELRIDGGAAAPASALPVLGGRAVCVTVGGRRRVVHLSRADTRGGLRATLDGRPVTLSVMDELRAQALQAQGGGAGSGTLVADIPGLVIDIRVQPGQAVQQGEPVIVVEAMKMQNELTAGVSGTVQKVAVAVGQSVNPGDVLVVIEPAPAD